MAQYPIELLAILFFTSIFGGITWLVILLYNRIRWRD